MMARNSFIIMASQAASAVFGLLALTIVSKLWGGFAPSLMGMVWFGMAFVGTLSFITNMGFDATHVKKVSEGKDLGTCIGTFIAIKLLLVSILVITIVGGIAIWKYLLHKEFYDATKESIIYIFLAFHVIFALAQIPIKTFNSMRKNVKSQLSIFMEPLVRAPLMILVALAGVTGAYITLEGSAQIINIPPRFIWPSIFQQLQDFLATHTIGAFAVSYLFGAFAMLFMGFVLLRKYPIKKPSREYMMMYLKFAAPLMVPVIFTLITLNIDKVMLGYFWSSVEVGHYFAVQRITAMILMISSAVGVVLFPTISSVGSNKQILKKKRARAIVSVTRKSERYSSMLVVPIVVLIIIFSVPIIDIFLNSSFRPATLSLQILSIYVLIFTLLTPYRYLILGMNKPKIFAKVIALGGIVNIVLNFLLIPRTGLLSQFNITGSSGAALSALVSALVILIGFRYYSTKIIRSPPFQGKILLHIIAGVIMGGALTFLSAFVSPIRWYHLIGFAMIGLSIYLAVLWVMKEFRRKDLMLFIDTIHPANILQYIKYEIREKP